jgi:hypothetical protein
VDVQLVPRGGLRHFCDFNDLALGGTHKRSTRSLSFPARVSHRFAQVRPNTSRTPKDSCSIPKTGIEIRSHFLKGNAQHPPVERGRTKQRISLPMANVMTGSKINFEVINRAAITVLPAVLARILPGGKIHGHEYTVLNPRRSDRHLGSFRINIRSGRWADFAISTKGGDPVSLVAYVEGVSQSEAARRLARMLGLRGHRE